MMTILIRKKNLKNSFLLNIWKKKGINPLNVVKDEKKAINNELFDCVIIFLEIRIPYTNEAIKETKKILFI